MKNPLSLSDTLKILEHPDGGYSDYNPAIPNLYSTHYCLKLLNLRCFDWELPHKTETVKWLRNVSDNDFKSKRLNDEELDVIYYWSKCADTLDIEVDDTTREEVIELLHQKAEGSAQVVHGVTPFDPDLHELSKLYKIIDLYQSLDVQFEVHSSLITWLVAQWEQNSLDNREKLARMSKICKLIKWTGSSPNDILNGQTPKEGISSVIHNIFQDGGEVQLPEVEHGWELAVELGEDVALTEPELERLGEMQNQDGGFGVFNEPISDNRGTFIAARILFHVDRLDVIDQKALSNFIQFNTVDKGGFSFRYRQDPSLDNTFAIHRLVSKNDKEISTVRSLDHSLPGEIPPEEPSTPSSLYKIIEIAKDPDARSSHLEVDRRINEFRSNISNISTEQDELLKEVYYTALLDQKFSSGSKFRKSENKDIINKLLDIRNSDGSYGKDDSARITQTYHAIYFLEHLGFQPPNKQETIRWIRTHREDDSGFRRMVENDFRPDIKSTYYATSTLSLLNEEIRNIEAILLWLDSLRQINGGRINSHSHEHPKFQHTVLAADLKIRLQAMLNSEA